MAVQSAESQKAQAAAQAASGGLAPSPSQTAGAAAETPTPSPSQTAGSATETLAPSPSQAASGAAETLSPPPSPTQTAPGAPAQGPSGIGAQTEAPPEKFGLNISVSVAGLVGDTADTPVTAAELVARLFESHSDYGPGIDLRELIAALRAPRRSPVRSGLHWVRRATQLYQPEVLVDGRRAVFGLALVEPRVWGQLQRFGALALLRSAIGTTSPRLEEQLSGVGREQLAFVELEADVTETRSDAPSDEDLLFREPFAEALALRIRSMRASDRKQRPLMLLLDGPWGSGKSTVMGFVRKMLEKPAEGEVRGGKDRWIAVDFNAWQYQRLESPWWVLANAVITRCIKAELGDPLGGPAGVALAARHFVFRTFTGRITTVLAALAAVAIGVALFSVPGGSSLVDVIKNFLAVVAVLFGVVAGAMKFLSPGDKASADYLNSRSDPMGALEKHLIDGLRSTPRPVIVFVDDLDRCDAPAVVKLLEGVQILFKAAPVVFLFAGDQRWVTHSFEVEYGEFKGVLKGESRPLGSVFLEKTFQLALWLPPPVEDGKRRYWDSLLGLKADEAQAQAAADLSDVQSEAGILTAAREVEASDDFAAKLAFRREAVRRLATPELERELQTHTLRPLLPLMESNPRSMKRLVMAYGMARSVDILTGRSSPAHALALWTVIAMRWPDLAAWLRDRPKRLQPAVPGPAVPGWTDADTALAAQLAHEDVQKVVRGPPGYGALTAVLLEQIVSEAPQAPDAAAR